MRSWTLAGGLFLAVVPAVPAVAATVYFHKAAVSRDAFVADATQCEELASGVQAPSQQQPYSANPYAQGAAAFLSGFMSSREKRGLVDNVLRTCMADKGYRRIDASPALRRELGKLSGTQRLERLAALAAATDPDGKVLPR